MGAMDAMVAKLQGEIEERESFINTLSAQATEAGRDLNDQEIAMVEAANTRIEDVKKSLAPLRQAQLSTIESRNKTAALDSELAKYRREYAATPVGKVEYRSTGEYLADVYWSRMDDRDAAERLEVFHTEQRAAAHQTTADNPGLLPERIVGPVINGIDAARPLVNAIGPENLGPGSWAYARVTQGTSVAAQSAEKAELASQKMTITKTSITAPTYGGYVNLARQDIRRSSPGILDMVISDLQGRYAIATEDATCSDLEGAATNSTLDIPATPTALQVSQSVWAAAGQSAALMRTANLPATGPILVVAPDQLGTIGPLFPLVNPSNAASTGFNAADASMQGAQGAISGLTVVMGLNLTAGKILFFYRSGVRVFEDRYGVLTVDEPSVWGMQVGVAGDFETVVLGGVINIEHA